jgi:hypothetical protein
VRIRRLTSGQYAVTSDIGEFILQRLVNVSREDYQWVVLTADDRKVLCHGYTKENCIGCIGDWERTGKIPNARDEPPNRRAPQPRKVAPGCYEVISTVGTFLVQKIDDRKGGDFKWAIYSQGGENLAEHFTKEDCVSLISDWERSGMNPFDPLGPKDSAPIDYYYSTEGTAIGPLSLTEITRLYQTGRITNDSYVFKQGDSQWRRPDAFPELSGSTGAHASAEGTATKL